MAALDEFLVSLDTYMKSNSKKSVGSGKFLANKMFNLFEDRRSPFSTTKGGIVMGLAEKIKDMTKRLSNATKITTVFDNLNKSVSDIATDFSKMSKKIMDSNSAMDKFIAGISNRVVAPTGKNNTPVNNPLSNISTDSTRMKMFNQGLARAFSTHYTYKTDKNGNKERKYALDVNLVSIKDSILKRFTGLINKPAENPLGDESNSTWNKFATSFNEFISTSKSSKYNDRRDRDWDWDRRSMYSENKSKGILGTLIGWITNILVLGAGVFGLGKLGDWLRNSPLGQTLANMFGEFGKSVKETFSSFFSKDKLGKSLDSFDNFLKDWIWTPISNVFGAIWDKAFTEENLKSAGKWIWEKISSLFTGLKENYDKGEWGKLLGKSGLIFLVFTKLGSLVPLLGLLSTGIGRVVMSLGKVAFSPLGLAITAFGAAIYGITDRLNALSLHTEDLQNTRIEISNLNTQILNNARKTVRTVDSELARLEKLPEEFQKRDSHRLQNILLWQQKEMASMIEQQKKESLAIANKQAQEGTTPILGLLATYDIVGGWKRQREAVDNKYMPMIRTLHEDIQKTNAALAAAVEAEKKSPTVGSIPPPIKANDAIIVQPHSKDQVLAAKTGGPVDTALKNMVSKLEEEIELMREGFSMLIAATTNSGQTVASAVIASNTAPTPSTTGGSNNIEDMRRKYGNRIAGK